MDCKWKEVDEQKFLQKDWIQQNCLQICDPHRLIAMKQCKGKAVNITEFGNEIKLFAVTD